MTREDMERAGEYVLGLLEAAETRAFEARLTNEPELAAAVARLQAQMHALDDTAGTLTPDPALWQRIASQLDAAVQDAPVPPAPLMRPANDHGWMRYAGLAASVVLALGIGYFGGVATTSQRQPVMIAVLLNEDGAQPGAIVEAFADDSVRLVPLDRFVLPQDRVFQVWTLPDPETGPVSLGIFDDPQAIRLAGPDLPPPQTGQLYEITLEPTGGSPTGRPTGPILAKGFAKPPVL